MSAEKLSLLKQSTETRLALLEHTLVSIDDNIRSIRSDLKDTKTEIKNAIYDVNHKIDSNQKWLIGTAISVMLGFVGILINAVRIYVS